MVTLYQPPGAWGIPSVSPFCVKLETWLRMAGVPYRRAPANPALAPKGKMPYIEFEGRKIGDSQIIVGELGRAFGVTLDDGFDAETLARGHAVRRMLEEGTYWALVHDRWVRAAGWAVYRPVFLGILPPFIGSLILPLLRRRVRGTLDAQGTGRHTADEIDALGIADIDALAALLGDRPFFLGDRPASVDAAIYAFVSSIAGFPAESRMGAAVASHPNLVAYRTRMEERFWPSQG